MFFSILYSIHSISKSCFESQRSGNCASRRVFLSSPRIAWHCRVSYRHLLFIAYTLEARVPAQTIRGLRNLYRKKKAVLLRTCNRQTARTLLLAARCSDVSASNSPQAFPDSPRAFHKSKFIRRSTPCVWTIDSCLYTFLAKSSIFINFSASRCKSGSFWARMSATSATALFCHPPIFFSFPLPLPLPLGGGGGEEPRLRSLPRSAS